MPLANRVSPFGELIAVAERGAWTGNRGRLHHADGTLMERRWETRRWICCVTTYKGRRKAPLAPGEYTSLFFMDEATALAAGHRPCALCRREAFDRFRRALAEGGSTAARADDIDRRLHDERVDWATGGKRLHPASWRDLPDGAMVAGPLGAGEVWLVAGHLLRSWTPGGYGAAAPRPRHGEAEALTPPTILLALANGYAPEWREVTSGSEKGL